VRLAVPFTFRTDEQLRILEAEGIDIRFINLSDAKSVREAFNGIEFVFILCSEDDMETIKLETPQLLKAVEENKKNLKCLIYTIFGSALLSFPPTPNSGRLYGKVLKRLESNVCALNVQTIIVRCVPTYSMYWKIQGGHPRSHKVLFKAAQNEKVVRRHAKRTRHFIYSMSSFILH